MWSHMDVIWSNAIVLGITPTTIKTGFCCLYSFCHYSAPGKAIFRNYMRYGKSFLSSTIWFTPHVTSLICLEVIKGQRWS